MGKTVKLAIVLFVSGFLGVLTLMLTDIPFNAMPLPEEALQKINEIPKSVFKLLLLINPTIMLLVATAIGAALYKKVEFKVPIIEALVNKETLVNPFKDLKSGIIGGIIAGLGMMLAAEFLFVK